MLALDFTAPPFPLRQLFRKIDKRYLIETIRRQRKKHIPFPAKTAHIPLHHLYSVSVKNFELLELRRDLLWPGLEPDGRSHPITAGAPHDRKSPASKPD